MAFTPDTLQDRIAIVTGASQGIGRAIAVEIAKVGAHVVPVSRRPAALEPVADLVRAAGRRALPLGCDVADAGQVDDVVARTLDTFGRIDVLVNNAGYRIRSRLEDLPRQEWDAMVGTNLTGVFLLSQAVGRVMIRQRAGKIVNVTSVAGRTGSRGLAAYAASKAGVEGLVQMIAHRYAGRSIRANLIVTGYVETALSATLPEAARRALIDGCPLRRAAIPAEIASLAMFLLSDGARGIDGQSVFATGGLLEVPS
jgi:3-oxoacyl-[acyl-carrier protein] reductase